MEQKLEDADRTSGCTSDTDNKNRRSQKFTNLGERREGDTLHWMGNTIGKKKNKPTTKKWAERLKKKKKKTRNKVDPYSRQSALPLAPRSLFRKTK